MKKLALLAGLGAISLASAATAHDTETAYASRGACEAASAAMSNAEQDFLLESFPDVFSSPGEVSSFLTRAWTCDRSSSDGQYYITDHIDEILGSRWFDQRNH